MTPKNRAYYLSEISKRGDAYGGNGGTLDLLNWCGKTGLYYVTEDEARRFFEDPKQPYEQEPAI